MGVCLVEFYENVDKLCVKKWQNMQAKYIHSALCQLSNKQEYILWNAVSVPLLQFVRYFCRDINDQMFWPFGS